MVLCSGDSRQAEQIREDILAENQRLCREGIPEDYARKRVSAQKGEDFFRSHCDYILENDEGDTPETFRLRARALFAGLLNAK